MSQKIELIKYIFKSKFCYEQINNSINIIQFSMQLIENNFIEYKDDY